MMRICQVLIQSLPTIISILGSALIAYFGYIQIRKNDNIAHLRIKKTEIYEKAIHELDFLYSSVAQKECEEQIFTEVSDKLGGIMIWGSDQVYQRAYDMFQFIVDFNKYINNGICENDTSEKWNNDYKERYDALIREIRIDLNVPGEMPTTIFREE